MAVSRRLTRQRKLVLDTVSSSHNHPTAEDVYQSLKADHPEISLGTVYRNLHVLCEQGEIQKVQGDFSSDRFDGRVFTHYHFTCTKCGELFDLPGAYQSGLDQAIEADCGHQVEKHSIMFQGVCASCAAPARQKKPLFSVRQVS